MGHWLLLVVILLNDTLAYSASFKGFPRGCEPVGFGFENFKVSLNQFEEQSLFFVQNRSDTTLVFTQQLKDTAFFSHPHRVKLKANAWAGLALNEKNMLFTCRHGATLTDCHKAIRLCQYPRARFSDSNGGNYWVAKNTTLQKTMQGAISKGIFLHW